MREELYNYYFSKEAVCWQFGILFLIRIPPFLKRKSGACPAFATRRNRFASGRIKNEITLSAHDRGKLP
jgi:hypothetical protein